MYIQYIYSFPNCFPKLLSLTHHVNFFLWEETREHKEIIPILLYNTGHEHTRQQKSHQIIVPQARAQGINELN